jgi:hypothetical protein
MNAPKCIICLGRFGDILNALPIAKRIFDETGVKPFWAVAKDYASIFESVSYVEPVIWPGRFEQLVEAVHFYKHKGWQIIQAQIYGFGYSAGKIEFDSFCGDAYRIAGYKEAFQAGDFDNIVLDRRHDEDERVAYDMATKGDNRNLILVNTGGTSSPFMQARELIATLGAFKSEIVLDLSNIRLKRIGDLLGFYDRASILITTDTSTVHLAGACHKLPYIALITDKPSRWHGAYTRGNCLARVRYNHYHMWKPHLIDLIAKAVTRPSYPIRLVHAFHIPPFVGAESARRNRVARGTWNAASVLGWREEIGLRLEDMPRTFDDGDRRLCFVKELIDAAYSRCNNEKQDAIMLCNTDTCLSLDFYKHACNLLAAYPAFCGPRRDFGRLEGPLIPSQVIQGHDYNGTDLFIFRPEWWKQNRSIFPDMVLGGEAWDCIMREMMKKQKLPFVRNLIYHERHASRWEQPKNIRSLPMQKHNIRLAIEALTKLNIGWRPGMFGVTPCP